MYSDLTNDRNFSPNVVHLASRKSVRMLLADHFMASEARAEMQTVDAPIDYPSICSGSNGLAAIAAQSRKAGFRREPSIALAFSDPDGISKGMYVSFVLKPGTSFPYRCVLNLSLQPPVQRTIHRQCSRPRFPPHTHEGCGKPFRIPCESRAHRPDGSDAGDGRRCPAKVTVSPTTQLLQGERAVHTAAQMGILTSAWAATYVDCGGLAPDFLGR